jgi:hypothetical protein
MRASGWIGLLGLGCVFLAACAEQHNSVDTDKGLVLMQTGAPILSCRDACLADWRREQPQAQQLTAAGQWRDLAALLIRVGYQDDLSLFYLGRAAEGLGFTTGAAAYYHQSKELSGSAIACITQSKQCGGLVFPQAASLRLSAVTLELERSRRTPTGSSPGKPVPATTEGVVTGSATSSETLPPQPVLAPAPAPQPAPPPPRPADAKDFIEPPPAQR